MDDGRHRGFRKAWGLLLTLCLAGIGCRSTPIGQAVYGTNEDPTVPKRFVRVPHQTTDQPPAYPIIQNQPPLETIAWRPAHSQAGSTGDLLLSAPTENKPGVTPISYRAQDTPIEFPVTMQAPDKAAAAAEVLPAPRPLPGAPIHMDALPPGVAMPMVDGPGHGPVPHELNMMSLPPYTVEPPDILLIESSRGLPTQPVKGQHLVRPDGTINLGIYGDIYVTGMTLDQIKVQVARAIASRLDKDVVAKNPVKPEDVSVDVLAYNSKVYYVITDGGGYGEQVYRLPVTGNERVLDALAQINGLPAVSSKRHIWVARRVPGHGAHDEVLPVDWCGITQRGEAATNYQIFPGDRVYVKAQKLITIDSTIAKILSPIERLLGVTLLGSETVNSIRNRGSSGSTP
jgi:polysaccharide export outer membrane protein